ncbi:hypothetical protein TNCV_4713501 [Trichonephila clavipes]|nr:hypothetical protein TNCV_4713501 [Trichonephila clavipes]
MLVIWSLERPSSRSVSCRVWVSSFCVFLKGEYVMPSKETIPEYFQFGRSRDYDLAIGTCSPSCGEFWSHIYRLACELLWSILYWLDQREGKGWLALNLKRRYCPVLDTFSRETTCPMKSH